MTSEELSEKEERKKRKKLKELRKIERLKDTLLIIQSSSHFFKLPIFYLLIFYFVNLLCDSGRNRSSALGFFLVERLSVVTWSTDLIVECCVSLTPDVRWVLMLLLASGGFLLELWNHKARSCSSSDVPLSAVLFHIFPTCSVYSRTYCSVST